MMIPNPKSWDFLTLHHMNEAAEWSCNLRELERSIHSQPAKGPVHIRVHVPLWGFRAAVFMILHFNFGNGLHYIPWQGVGIR